MDALPPMAVAIQSSEITAIRERVMTIRAVEAIIAGMTDWVEKEYETVGWKLQAIVDAARTDDHIGLGDAREDDYFTVYAEAVGLDLGLGEIGIHHYLP